MNWFDAIPKIFVGIITIIALFGVIVFLQKIDFTNTDRANENIQDTTDMVVETVIPTEVNWIQWIVNRFSNPWIIIILIFIVLWLFGHFSHR